MCKFFTIFTQTFTLLGRKTGQWKTHTLCKTVSLQRQHCLPNKLYMKLRAYFVWRACHIYWNYASQGFSSTISFYAEHPSFYNGHPSWKERRRKTETKAPLAVWGGYYDDLAQSSGPSLRMKVLQQGEERWSCHEYTVSSAHTAV